MRNRERESEREGTYKIMEGERRKTRDPNVTSCLKRKQKRNKNHVGSL